MIIDGKARILKQAIKDPFHRKDSRPAVDGCIPYRHLAHLAANRGSPLNHLNLMAQSRKVDRRGKTAHPSANDDDLLGLHEAAPAVWLARARRLNRIWW